MALPPHGGGIGWLRSNAESLFFFSFGCNNQFEALRRIKLELAWRPKIIQKKRPTGCGVRAVSLRRVLESGAQHHTEFGCETAEIHGFRESSARLYPLG